MSILPLADGSKMSNVIKIVSCTIIIIIYYIVYYDELYKEINYCVLYDALSRIKVSDSRDIEQLW